MLNYETAGSELLKVNSDPERSTADIIVNEDYCMVMKVIAVFGGIVEASKVWDSGDTRFYARLKYHGKDGVPDDSELEVGQHVIFHRTGEFSNSGEEGFELHEEDVTKTSWVCFIHRVEIISIQDNGNGTGFKVEYINGLWVAEVPVKTYILKSPDPDSCFHNDAPSWKEGRIYQGRVFDNVCIVSLQGFGDETKTFVQTINGAMWTIGTDSSGKVITFEVQG